MAGLYTTGQSMFNGGANMFGSNAGDVSSVSNVPGISGAAPATVGTGFGPAGPTPPLKYAPGYGPQNNAPTTTSNFAPAAPASTAYNPNAAQAVRPGTTAPTQPGIGQFDPSYLQNLATYIGGLFARPQNNQPLTFNPLGNLSDISGAQPQGAGNAPTLGLPQTLAQQAINANLDNPAPQEATRAQLTQMLNAGTPGLNSTLNYPNPNLPQNQPPASAPDLPGVVPNVWNTTWPGVTIPQPTNVSTTENRTINNPWYRS